jgi:citrate synthase
MGGRHLEPSDTLTAAEAAAELGISLPTLYSYVSRGLIRSENADRSRRTRHYDAGDVQRLKDRQEQRRDPAKVIEKVIDEALHWGTPMLDSAITLIERGNLYYRGQSALTLAETETPERVAALIWTGERERATGLFDGVQGALSPRCVALRDCLPDSTAVEQFQILLPAAGTEDVAAYDLRPNAVAQAGARLLCLLTALAADQPQLDADIATTLQRAWRPNDSPGNPNTARLLGAALILCADHELNVSSFTARCVASAGSPPYAVVSAGLAALQGAKHGGATARVEALFREADSPRNARATIASRIRRGETIPGFGHRLYLQGDPRGQLLLDWIRRDYLYSPGVALANALIAEAGTALNDHPNVDFGLVTLCRALELPPGSALTLFALGRTIGWIGHAIEEYQANRLIRPRANYTGNQPSTSD